MKRFFKHLVIRPFLSFYGTIIRGIFRMIWWFYISRTYTNFTFRTRCLEVCAEMKDLWYDFWMFGVLYEYDLYRHPEWEEAYRKYIVARNDAQRERRREKMIARSAKREASRGLIRFIEFMILRNLEGVWSWLIKPAWRSFWWLARMQNPYWTRRMLMRQFTADVAEGWRDFKDISLSYGYYLYRHPAED